MQIPDAELDVLAVLWRRGPLTAAEIRESLKTRRPLTHASVSTLLRRLQDRGMVLSEKAKRGKAFIFRATRPVQVRKKLAKSFLDRVFDGCGIELVSTLLRSQSYSESDLDEIQRLIGLLRDNDPNAKE